MADAIPWDKIVGHYDNLFKSAEGRLPISGRVILGAMMIKHIESLTDRGTIQHIRENMFMQYFWVTAALPMKHLLATPYLWK